MTSPDREFDARPKRVCPVCGKTVKPGEHMGFSPVHRGPCAARWNKWSPARRCKALETVYEKEGI